MKRHDFIQGMRDRIAERLELLERKGHAYSGDADAFANFKRNAALTGTTKYQVWFIYFQKHLDAITQAIKDNPQNPVDKSEGLQGRINDAINYLDLLAGMLDEDSNEPMHNDLPPSR